MIFAVIYTFALTVLAVLSALLYRDNRRKDDRIDILVEENLSLHNQIGSFEYDEHQRREKEMYQKGLYDGRETDTLYRSILARYTRGEQATVMMQGEGGQVHE